MQSVQDNFILATGRGSCDHSGNHLWGGGEPLFIQDALMYGTSQTHSAPNGFCARRDTYSTGMWLTPLLYLCCECVPAHDSPLLFLRTATFPSSVPHRTFLSSHALGILVWIKRQSLPRLTTPSPWLGICTCELAQNCLVVNLSSTCILLAQFELLPFLVV